jgi:Mn-dependent DtxR family transcriptional regulator
MEWREKELYSIIAREGEIKTVDIVAKANMCKVTVLKYLRILREKGLVDYEMVGPTKVWSVKKRENTKTHREIIRLIKEIERLTGQKAVVILNPSDLVAMGGLRDIRG